LLVSHHLCPYVQRAAIVAAEKKTALERVYIDLAEKPDWFMALSPTGKVPLLKIIDEFGREHILFESAAIAEYLDESGPGQRLMPDTPLERAYTRAWVEFASGTLGNISGVYAAASEVSFEATRKLLVDRFLRIEAELVGPWFAGASFGLVDAAFAPVFRYLDAFELAAGLRLVDGLPMVAAWRSALAERPSVAQAVAGDYAIRLQAFLLARKSYLSEVMRRWPTPL